VHLPEPKSRAIVVLYQMALQSPAKFIIWLVVFWQSSSNGISILPILGAKHRNLSRNFVQAITFKVAHPEQIDTIFYGNSVFGYFKLSTVERGFGKIRIELIPPGYKSPVEFFSKQENGRINKLGERRFINPLPLLFRRPVKITGKLRGPYYLMSGVISNTVPYYNLADGQLSMTEVIRTNGIEGSHSLVYHYIVNKLGEVIWAHVPNLGKAIGPAKEITALGKPVAGGLYGFLQQGAFPSFELVSFRGDVRQKFDPKMHHPPFDLNPDFHFLSEDRVLLISRSKKYFRAFHSGGVSELFADRLVEVNITNKKVKPLWDPTRFESPARILSQINLDSVTKEEGWDLEKKHADPYFMNSVSPDGQGYLIALKNRHQLVYLDKAFQVMWSIGPRESDTYQLTKEQRFKFPRTAQPMPNGNILVLANSSKGATQAMEIARKKGSVEIVKTFIPTPALLSKRGSASFNKERVAGYFPMEKEAVLIEFDYKTQKELGRMTIKQPTQAGLRATPLKALAQEVFYSMKPPKVTRAATH